MPPRVVFALLAFTACRLVGTLAAADVQGPDGHRYPDFSGAGIPGGIPDVAVVAHVVPPADPTADLAPAIEAAVAEALAAGGGAVFIPAGEWWLRRPLTLVHSNIVLRGAGMDRTHLRFDHDLAEGEVRIVRPAEGETLRPGAQIEAHYHTRRMQKVSLFLDDTLLHSLGPDSSDGDRFWIFDRVGRFAERIQGDRATFRVVVERFDGTRSETSRTVKVDLATPDLRGAQHHLGDVSSIQFVGDVESGRSTLARLADSVRRGERVITLSGADHAFAPGDAVILQAASSPAFIADLASARKDIPRAQAFNVVAVDGARVTLDPAIRTDLALTDSPALVRLDPIRRVGVEHLTLEHTRRQWVNGITFRGAWESWVREVRIIKPGRNPVGFSHAKNIEIRDSEFADKWFTAGGGTGYLGFGYAWDSLISGVRTTELRHAPNLQSAASGNVVTRSRFHSSDVNFHMQWAHDNLIELCEIDARRGTGSYGYGIFAQVPETAVHGPGGGPRNVFWNNRIRSPRAAIYLGGSNRDWTFAHNVFEVTGGPAVIQRKRSVGHRFLHNVFILRDGSAPGFVFETDDNGGSTYLDNVILGGSGELRSGVGAANLPADAGVRHLAADDTFAPPAPDVESLFEWQRARKR